MGLNAAKWNWPRDAVGGGAVCGGARYTAVRPQAAVAGRDTVPTPCRASRARARLPGERPVEDVGCRSPH